jgi:hypothetical protein
LTKADEKTVHTILAGCYDMEGGTAFFINNRDLTLWFRLQLASLSIVKIHT